MNSSQHPKRDLHLERNRANIPEYYKWNLDDLYPSTEVWKRSKTSLLAEIPSVDRFRGALSGSPGALLECLVMVSRLSKEYARLSTYASLCSDLDTRDGQMLSLVQEMAQVGSDFAARTSFIQPEILLLDPATIDAFIKREPGLAIYRHDLHDILRRKEHTGTEGEEKIIADASLMADGPDNIYGIFSNAEFPFPSVVFSDGKTARIDKSAFSLYRALPNRDDRKKVFGAYFGSLNEFRRTFGTQLYAEVKKDLFYMKARRYSSSLHAALDGNNIPVEVYRSLLDNVNAHLPTFHRYLALRRSLLGVDQLHYYDLYAPLVEDLDLSYSYEEARDHILTSLAPLGTEYGLIAKRALQERWVDVYPNDGKRSGAYSNGAAYDVHPYILMNYNGKYDDVSTLTHELGHTMHSYLSNTHQPYPTSQYSIFVAEVASTFNEALLMEYMLKTISDDSIRLSLLGNALDTIRGTVFRQVQFAEFELRIHEVAEAGESLTGDVFSEIYDQINKRYYGHEQGICIVDDEIKSEWAHIPHFYYNFYVFQYATSFTASAALSEQVIGGDTTATKRYLELLSSGGSDYPMALLKKAGIDMASAAPFELTMKRMNRIMEEIEKIVKNRKGKPQ